MLRIDHLTKTYGEKKAVDDLSLHIAPGEKRACVSPAFGIKSEQTAGGAAKTEQGFARACISYRWRRTSCDANDMEHSVRRE